MVMGNVMAVMYLLVCVDSPDWSISLIKNGPTTAPTGSYDDVFHLLVNLVTVDMTLVTRRC